MTSKEEDNAITFEDLPNELLRSVIKLAHNEVYAAADQYGHGVHPMPVEVAASLRLGYERDRLQEYLKRSVNTDLELCFRFGAIGPSSSVLAKGELLASTLEHASRWRRLVLTSEGEDDALISFHRPLKKLSVPKLQYLDVRTSRFHDHDDLGWDSEPDWNPKLFFAEVCPSIEFLRLDVSAAMAQYRPRFENLVHFCFQPGPDIGPPNPVLIPSCFISVIQLPSIETISLWGNIYWAFQPKHIPALEAKQLRHFRVGGTTVWGIFTLLFLIHQVTAPLLESITIQGCDFSDQEFGFANLDPSHSEYTFPSFRSLYLIKIKLFTSLEQNDPDLFFNQLLGQLATRTRRAKNLTLSFGMERSLLAGLEAGTLQLCPEVEELTWNSPPSGFPLEVNDLKNRWPKLTRIRVPPHLPIASDAEDIEVNELRVVGHESWPPGYGWASSCREDDPFFSSVMVAL